MKVIFLDIDGVLNTSQTFIDIYEEYTKTGIRRVEIDLNRVQILKEIVDETNAVIVLISSWKSFGKMINGTYIPLNKKMTDLLNIFERYGLYIYDIVSESNEAVNKNEIYAWLEGKDVDSFIILTDDTYYLKDFINKELIRTTFNKSKKHSGLCDSNVQQAIKILNKNIKI